MEGCKAISLEECLWEEYPGLVPEGDCWQIPIDGGKRTRFTLCYDREGDHVKVWLPTVIYGDWDDEHQRSFVKMEFTKEFSKRRW